MRVPALNWLDQGLPGGSGTVPGVVCLGTTKNRSKARSSVAGVPGGSAWYAVSEKRTSP